MKKATISLLLMLALVICAGVATVPTAEAVEDVSNHTNHDGWTEWNQANTSIKDANDAYTEESIIQSVAASSTVNQPGLKGGKYVLTGNVEFTQIKIAMKEEVTICLNGYTLSYDDEASAGRLIDLATGTSSARTILNICDCKGGGEVKQTQAYSSGDGGNVYMRGYSTLNLYGGKICGGNATKASAKGGNICVANANAVFNMHGGEVAGGSAAGNGGNIYNTGKLNIYGGNITGGTANAGNAVFNGSNGTFAYKGGTIEKQVYSTGPVMLGGNITIHSAFTVKDAAVTLVDDLHLDLNGKTFTGNITTGDYKFYGKDSATDDFELETTADGLFKGTITGNIANGEAFGVGDHAKYRYVAIPETDGYSFHRIYIGIESIQLSMTDDNKIGMSYTTNFQADEAVLAKLADTGSHAYGYNFGRGSLDNATPVGYSASETFKAKVTANITAILDGDTTDAEDYIEQLWAQTFISLDLGEAEPTVIESNIYKYSLKDVYDAMIEIDTNTEDGKDLPADAKTILTCMETTYKAITDPNPEA